MKLLEYQDPPRAFDMFRARLYLATWYRVRYEWPEAMVVWMVRHFPRWVVYRAVILAYSRAWYEVENKTPDELTFEEVVQPWQRDGAR